MIYLSLIDYKDLEEIAVVEQGSFGVAFKATISWFVIRLILDWKRTIQLIVLCSFRGVRIPDTQPKRPLFLFLTLYQSTFKRLLRWIERTLFNHSIIPTKVPPGGYFSLF